MHLWGTDALCDITVVPCLLFENVINVTDTQTVVEPPTQTGWDLLPSFSALWVSSRIIFFSSRLRNFPEAVVSYTLWLSPCCHAALKNTSSNQTYTSSAKNRPGSVKPTEGEKTIFTAVACWVWVHPSVQTGRRKGGFLCRVASFWKAGDSQWIWPKKQTIPKKKKLSHCKFEHVSLATGVGGVKYAVRQRFGHSWWIRNLITLLRRPCLGF